MTRPPAQAVFGGTFNPIHNGHLRSAQELLDRLPIAHLRFVPAHIPPHRELPEVSSEERARMVEAAIAEDPRLSCDRRELARAGPSYTVDTLVSLRSELGSQTPLVLVVGCDAFQELDTWYRWRELATLAHLVVMARPGWSLPRDGDPAVLLRKRYAPASDLAHAPYGCVVPVELQPWPVSSTEIRALLQSGGNAQALLPPATLAYVQQHGLYSRA